MKIISCTLLVAVFLSAIHASAAEAPDRTLTIPPVKDSEGRLGRNFVLIDGTFHDDTGFVVKTVGQNLVLVQYAYLERVPKTTPKGQTYIGTEIKDFIFLFKVKDVKQIKVGKPLFLGKKLKMVDEYESKQKDGTVEYIPILETVTEKNNPPPKSK